MEWQPIETAPHNGTKCVVGAFIKDSGWCMGICWYEPRHGQWLTMSGNMPDGKPTHWLPLPEPPKVGADAGVVRRPSIAESNAEFEEFGF